MSSLPTGVRRMCGIWPVRFTVRFSSEAPEMACRTDDVLPAMESALQWGSQTVDKVQNKARGVVDGVVLWGGEAGLGYGLCNFRWGGQDRPRGVSDIGAKARRKGSEPCGYIWGKSVQPRGTGRQCKGPEVSCVARVGKGQQGAQCGCSWESPGAGMVVVRWGCRW